MGFMNKDAEDIGWNDCIIYLQSHLDEFHDSLQGGQYDYFPYERRCKQKFSRSSW